MEKKELLAGFLALATGYLLVNQLRPEDGPIVEIENGFIKGVIRYSDGGRRPYKAFYKIPYASVNSKTRYASYNIYTVLNYTLMIHPTYV